MKGKGEDLLGRLTERPPLTVREGGMIRGGVYPELDELVNGIRDGREWLNGLQAREREATGISTLKVGYNKVFGYYIEVTKAQEDKVPANYLRKQSLVGAERYITPEMKDWESRILGAEGEINACEYRIFCALRESVNAAAGEILDAARILGSVDVLCCLAKAARDLRFSRPELSRGLVPAHRQRPASRGGVHHRGRRPTSPTTWTWTHRKARRMHQGEGRRAPNPAHHRPQHGR